MSIILGIHLLERVYLVSDTRVSYTDSDEIKDDLIKAFVFNKRVSAIAAGRALASSFILNKLKLLTSEQTTISEFKRLINDRLRPLISDYVNTTGYHSGQVALIFGGFNFGNKKKIEASLLGNAMSAMVVKAGERRTVNQSIDKRLKNSLGQLGGKGRGDYIVVDGVQEAELFSVTFDIGTANISSVQEAECYEYLVYHPQQNIRTIQLPPEITSILEFRERSGQTTEQIHYENAEILINFVRRVVRENNFKTVGGHIFPLLQTPHQAIFPAGDLARFESGCLVKAGRFDVEEGKVMYKLESGESGEYRFLGDMAKKYLKKEGETEYSEMLI
jgi:hypothetical protein